MLEELPQHVTEETKSLSDAELRTRINRMIGSAIPRRAKKRRWKLRETDTFRRIIYDNVCGAPWDQVVSPPAIRNMSRTQLELVLTLAVGLLDGKVRAQHLLTRSTAMRS